MIPHEFSILLHGTAERIGRMLAKRPGVDPTGRFRPALSRRRPRRIAVSAFGDVSARTRPGPTYRLEQSPDDPAYGHSTDYGSRFEYAAAPTSPTAGTVRDQESGKPLAGVSVRGDHFAGNVIHGRDFVRTMTDERGEFRLMGMPGGPGNGIVIIPPPGLPYIGSAAEVRDSAGIEPIRVDTGLKGGVTIRGRVTDKATGRPVPARVDYLSFLDNPHYRASPRILHRGFEGLRTREDGSFELIGLPGHGLVAARAVKDRYLIGQGAEKIAARRDNNGRFDTGPGPCQPEYNHRIVELNPADDVRSLACDLELDPGRGRVEDSNGKPLIGVTASNLAPHTVSPNTTQLASAHFMVLALDPRTPRPVFFRHSERKLGAFVIARGDEKGPLVVRMEPGATITGRLLDSEGQPFTSVQFQGSHSTGSFKPRVFSDFPRPTIQTSRRFRIEEVIPGIAYEFMAIRGHKLPGRIAKDFILKPRETRDLGNVAMKSKLS